METMGLYRSIGHSIGECLEGVGVEDGWPSHDPDAIRGGDVEVEDLKEGELGSIAPKRLDLGGGVIWARVEVHDILDS
jgi:hypothetical protein